MQLGAVKKKEYLMLRDATNGDATSERVNNIWE
jgi:hypothetical protein